MPLTDAKIRSAKAGPKPIKLTDGAGLYLEVRPTGATLWRYRYRISGKENVYALGEYPTLSLSEARQLRSEARALVKKGIHPAKHRKAAQLVQQTQNANTFKAVTCARISILVPREPGRIDADQSYADINKGRPD